MATLLESAATGTHTFELYDNHVVRLRIADGAEVDMEQALEAHELMKKLIAGRTCVLLIDLRGSQFNTSAEARDFASTKEGSSTRIADAILLDSLAQALVGNFYIRFNKPRIPTRIFKSEEKAMEWLTLQQENYKAKAGRVKTS